VHLRHSASHAAALMNALRPRDERIDVTREAYPAAYSADSRISACWSSGG
jgi:hypothetical protein